MPRTTLQDAVLLVAIEMSNKTWKLGIRAGARHRFVDVPARELGQLNEAIAEAKRKWRLPPETAVVSCYEAGRDGFWLHRALEAMGVENLVVDPASIEVDRRARHKKTDKIDVKKLLKLLGRHVGGEEDVWSVVRIPTVETEDARRDSRERDRLSKERTQHNNRIRSLLITQGIDLTVTRKLPKQLESIELWDGSHLQPRLREELLREHARWEQVDNQLKDLDKRRRHALKEFEESKSVVPDVKAARISKESAPELLAPRAEEVSKVHHLIQLRGIGERGAWKLIQEYFWRDFNNRREVGAAAGLTGTPYNSGDSEREQGISKAGSRPVRGLMIELGWCWLRFQPDSVLTHWFNERFGNGKRSRKVGIVALARRLLIAFWKYVEHGVVPAGATLSLK